MTKAAALTAAALLLVLVSGAAAGGAPPASPTARWRFGGWRHPRPARVQCAAADGATPCRPKEICVLTHIRARDSVAVGVCTMATAVHGDGAGDAVPACKAVLAGGGRNRGSWYRRHIRRRRRGYCTDADGRIVTAGFAQAAARRAAAAAGAVATPPATPVAKPTATPKATAKAAPGYKARNRGGHRRRRRDRRGHA